MPIPKLMPAILFHYLLAKEHGKDSFRAELHIAVAYELEHVTNISFTEYRHLIDPFIQDEMIPSIDIWIKLKDHGADIMRK